MTRGIRNPNRTQVTLYLTDDELAWVDRRLRRLNRRQDRYSRSDVIRAGLARLQRTAGNQPLAWLGEQRDLSSKSSAIGS